MKDVNHPFFRPLWLRIGLVLVCAAWSFVEWYNGNGYWAALTGAITLYAAWTFLYAYDPAPDDDPKP